MLVLSRKKKQGIVIGGNIEVVVVAVRGDTVKLGFNAPSEVSIHREEIARRIHDSQAESQCPSKRSAARAARQGCFLT